MSQEPEIDPRQVLWMLDRAKKQHAIARKLLKDDPDLAVLVAYEAMMGASVAWMLSHGEHPLGKPDRADVLEFVERSLPDGTTAMLHWFYRIPEGLNGRFYDIPSNDVGSPDALSVAESYLMIVTHLINKNRDIAAASSPSAAEQAASTSRPSRFLKSFRRGKFGR
ncbi:hypothetical protein [Occallatibacter savannae]|uniref:hypothetical protein n=1 Tax=Occallatibacter savannae TaxID=1002691 RepID=UPI000D698FFF|nr:hypothetical protein [Occallatibacter savannae]